MPKIAEPIGMPAAITEPKATSSTITAIGEADRLLALDLFDTADDLARQLGLEPGVAGDLDRVERRLALGRVRAGRRCSAPSRTPPGRRG